METGAQMRLIPLQLFALFNIHQTILDGFSISVFILSREGKFLTVVCGKFSTKFVDVDMLFIILYI